jgi:HD-GYP domain-containing protein (c-di-GMP phosphodiesterase class II)
MKCLYIGDHEDPFFLFQLTCIREFKFSLTLARTYDETIEQLTDEHIDFIIMVLPQSFTENLMSYLQEHKFKTQVVFTTTNDLLNSSSQYIDHPNYYNRVSYQSGQQPIINCISDIIKEFGLKLSEEKESYYPIPLRLFLDLETTHFDLFLKLSDKKMIKVFRQGDQITLSDIEKFEGKKCENFFLRAKDFSEVVEIYLARLLVSLKSEEVKNSVISAELLKFSHNSVRTMVKNLGIRPKVVELTVNSLNVVKKAMTADKIIREKIKEIMTGKHYLSEHSLLLCFLTSAIVYESKWDRDAGTDKLTYAAYFHDLATDDEEMATLDLHPNTLKSSQVSRANDYLNHPSKAIEMITKLPFITNDVVRIIQMHHEKYDGSGFPHGITHEKIPPLASIFIIAEEVVTFLYKNNRDLSLLPVIANTLEEKYKEGNFSKIVGYMRTALALSSKPRSTYSLADKEDE